MPNVADPLLEAWGRSIRFLRLRSNRHGEQLRDGEEAMTQAELGASLDPPVSQGAVAKWEAGLREPKRRYKPQIEDVFEIPRGSLFVSDPKQVPFANVPLPVNRSRAKAVA